MTNALAKVRQRIEENEEGFTLIELMVVVLIIGILMAIAIPTFLSAKNSANARSAQSNVRNAYTSEAAQFSNNQNYEQSTGAMQTNEPSLTWGQFSAASWTAGGKNVYVEATPSGTSPSKVLIGSLGSDQKCYYVFGQDGQTTYGQGTPVSGACTAAAAPVTTWSQSWGGASASAPDLTGLASAA